MALHSPFCPSPDKEGSYSWGFHSSSNLPCRSTCVGGYENGTYSCWMTNCATISVSLPGNMLCLHDDHFYTSDGDFQTYKPTTVQTFTQYTQFVSLDTVQGRKFGGCAKIPNSRTSEVPTNMVGLKQMYCMYCGSM